jgi:predicted transglutaminase-like cysteine proteinase
MKELAKKVHWDVLTHFVYVPDHVIHPDFFDHWESHADEVEADKVFRGDCDNAALTNAELSIRRGANPAIVKLIYCKAETGEGHLVAGLEHWILDNRQRGPIYWEDLPYRWISSMRMDEPGIWRKL